MTEDKQSGESKEGDTRFLSCASMKVMLVPLFCGLLYGYNLGFVPSFYEMHLVFMDCSMFNGGKLACESVPYADCRWFSNSSAGGYCGWTDITCRVAYPNSAMFGGDASNAKRRCEADNRCSWSFLEKECKNPVGYDSWHHAFFAGAITFGAAVGSGVSGRIVMALGTRLSLVAAGLVSLVCVVMTQVSIATDDLWVNVVARFALGLCTGVTTVASSLYVDQNAPQGLKRTLGSTYMVFVSLGVFLAALMGLCLGHFVSTTASGAQNLVVRLHCLNFGALVFSVGVTVLGLFVKETRVQFMGAVTKATDTAVEVLNPNEYSYTQMVPRLLLGVVLSCSGQLTGMNAFVNYAPTILGNLGLAPLVGSFVVMSVSLIGAITTIPLSFFWSPRTLFLAGTLSCATMCLFFCGVPEYPGVADESVRTVLAVIGTGLFMASWQWGVAPYFYVLAQEIYPPSFRPKGFSITLSLVYAFSLIVTFTYPSAVVAMSGGKSGDQSQGQSLAFIFFGVVGIVSFVIAFFLLHPWVPAHITPDNSSNEPT